MHLMALLAGGALLPLVLWETLETMILPRRVSRRFRLTRVFYRVTWWPWQLAATRLRAGQRRETFLSVYGPASLLFLLATWAGLVVVAFGLLHWGAGGGLRPASGAGGLDIDLYYSGTTFFTVGLGDVTPSTGFDRLLTVVEGGTGLGFIALVIGYLPILAQAFSRREVSIALLDGRAGSPPSAVVLLARHAGGNTETLAPLLYSWERWSAELLETHVSFPVLAYYRSQHANQSWVAMLTMILDVCALTLSGIARGPVVPARLTFAMARHAAVDMTKVFSRSVRANAPDRLPPGELARLREALEAAGVFGSAGPEAVEKLHRLRGMYEPFLISLGEFLAMPLPPWVPARATPDNWQSTA